MQTLRAPRPALPLRTSRWFKRITALEGFFRAMDAAQTVEVEPLLRKLEAPALIVWGNADPFFHIRWA